MSLQALRKLRKKKNTCSLAAFRLQPLPLQPLPMVLFSHSGVQLFATPWTIARQASLSFPISRSLLKLMPTESVMPSNHLIHCCPLLLLPSIFPSIQVFSNESALRIRWPKCWSLSFRISPSNVYSGLISFRIEWFDLVVQGTLKSLFQHHSENTGYWPQIAKMHIKRMISVSPDSCIFPYLEKH